MVCYARPASWLAAIVVVAALVFGRPVGHFLDTAAFVAAATVTTAVVAVVSVLVMAAFMATRRRRAAAGGCVSCQFRCQHAMTEQPGRLWLVTTADRDQATRSVPPHGRPAVAQERPVSVRGRSTAAARSRVSGHGCSTGAPGGPAVTHVRPVPVLLPMPAVRSGCEPSGPRWPDRPVYHTNRVSQRAAAAGAAARAPEREPAGSPA